jgi:hypothetical protein
MLYSKTALKVTQLFFIRSTNIYSIPLFIRLSPKHRDPKPNKTCVYIEGPTTCNIVTGTSKEIMAAQSNKYYKEDMTKNKAKHGNTDEG